MKIQLSFIILRKISINSVKESKTNFKKNYTRLKLFIDSFVSILGIRIAIINHTEKTVSLNQRKIYLIYGQRNNFFELKKVLLIQKKFL